MTQQAVLGILKDKPDKEFTAKELQKELRGRNSDSPNSFTLASVRKNANRLAEFFPFVWEGQVNAKKGGRKKVWKYLEWKEKINSE